MEHLNLDDSIKKSKNILIITHVNPDGDALGSMIALRDLIYNHYKKKAEMMIVSKYGFGDIAAAENMKVDASRIAAGMIASIGFLGIGVIRIEGKETVGLTTSAGLLATVAIGLAAGAGMYVIAVFTAVMIFLLQLIPHKD